MTHPLPAERKRALREEMLARRKRLTASEREEASLAIAERVASLPAFAAARTVALYASMGAEVSTAEIARRAHAAGKRLAWPRLAPGALRLTFAACPPGELVSGRAGTREPPPDAPAVPISEIDCALVPGVAFDERGGRLGRGRGHYDATLGALPRRAVRVGLAFEVQLRAEVPREAHDASLDVVVTERRVVLARPGAGGAPSGG
ncbi:MAG TPA: 5-formyltetrahydrofolate cyclo-ligase [Anaeromyxobacteraceae bacterium]|nr:5-formyltetrahydrofolate cyclo-ligase [Anaeromyxobacteraceae bacterium]